MDLDKLLIESRERLAAMQIDEFEDMCIRAGFEPVRKYVFVRCESVSINLDRAGKVSYRSAVTVTSCIPSAASYANELNHYSEAA